MDAPIHCTALEMKTMTVDVARPPVNEDMEKAARSPRNTSFLLKRSDSPATQKQGASEGQSVGADDPLQLRGSEVKLRLHGRQGYVDYGKVQEYHELGQGMDG